MTEKPLLVLLHGWGSTAGVWQPVVERLQADFTCFQPELPAHGDSQFTETRLEPLARQILAEVDRPAIWLGWSLGALIAMQAALLMPQRVSQLLIVSGTPAFVQNADWDTAMPVDVFDQFQAEFANDASRSLKRFIALQAHGDRYAKSVMQQLGRSLTEGVNAIAWGLQVLRRGNLVRELSAIQCPVNGLYGETDALVPVTVQAAMHENANATVIAWPDTGHAPFLSQPDAFVDWVKGAAHG